MIDKAGLKSLGVALPGFALKVGVDIFLVLELEPR